MGKTFQKIHACSVGNFGSNTNKIPQWIRANSGKYSKNVGDEVTHLIATKEAFTQNAFAVQQAKELGSIMIVSYDWLEDSLLATKSHSPLPEQPYLWENLLKEAKQEVPKFGNAGQGRKAKTRKRTRKAKSRNPFDTKTRTARAQSIALKYRIYEDQGVAYNVSLARLCLLRNSREKYRIQIYESIAEPHTYAAHINYSRTGLSKAEFLVPLGSPLEAAMSKFKWFFKAKTGKTWEERNAVSPPSPRRDSDGNLLPAHQGWFYFEDEKGLLSSFLRNEAIAPGEQSDQLNQENS